MTVLTLYISNTTSEEATEENLKRNKGSFQINIGTPVAIDGRNVQLLEYTVVHYYATDPDGTKLDTSKQLIVKIPWLEQSSHIVGGAFNDADSPDADMLEFDKRRHSTGGIYLTCLDEASHVVLNNENFTLGRTVIPSKFDVTILDASSGKVYTNFSYIVLKFHIDRLGLIA